MQLKSLCRHVFIKHAEMLSLQSRLWETQKQLQQLRRQTAQMETLAVPMMLGATHRPLSRTQSSPASTSLTLPDKALPLTTAPEPPQSQPRFTTGTPSPPITRHLRQMIHSHWLKPQCVCVCRSGLWLPNAEAPVCMWRQQQPSRACWENPEHLVAFAGEGPQGPVWGIHSLHFLSFLKGALNNLSCHSFSTFSWTHPHYMHSSA